MGFLVDRMALKKFFFPRAVRASPVNIIPSMLHIYFLPIKVSIKSQQLIA
jgi:hypothetical protein